MTDFHQLLLTHFEVHDPVLYPYVLALNGRVLTQSVVPKDYFSRLTQDIISQQLSVKVADVIIARFQALLPNALVTPDNVLAIPDKTLRAAGLSGAKVAYIKDLATKTLAGDVDLDNLTEHSDEEITSELTRVKGIGQWTAEMFLLFTLGREDIFSFGDLGLKNGLIKVYGLDASDKKAFQAQALEISQKWRPYRSYASLALWKSLEK